MRLLTYIYLLLIALLGITFACLNADRVTINYYFDTKHIPLSLLLVMTLALGVGLGLLFNLLTYLRLKGDNIRLQRKIKMSEKVLTELSTLPIKDSH